MEAVTKSIFSVVSTCDENKQFIRKIAADDLVELLSFFNKEGLHKIIKIEKIEDKITYFH